MLKQNIEKLKKELRYDVHPNCAQADECDLDRYIDNAVQLTLEAAKEEQKKIEYTRQGGFSLLNRDKVLSVLDSLSSSLTGKK